MSTELEQDIANAKRRREAREAQLAAMTELTMTREEVYEFLSRLGLGKDSVGYVQDLTFHPDGTIEVEFLGATLNDIRVDEDALEAISETRWFRLKDAY